MKSWVALYVSNNKNIFTLSKNTQSDSWGLFTSSHHIRAEADQPHCEMAEAKPLKSHVRWIQENLIELN